MQLRSIIVLSALWLAIAGCSKNEDKTPYAEAETSSGYEYEEGPAERTGEELDSAADEAADEAQRMEDDREEALDEATDQIEEADDQIDEAIEIE